MNGLKLINVAPRIPHGLEFLELLSRNLWWCWHPDAVELFRRMDPILWNEVRENPMCFLSRLPETKLQSLSEDDGFLTHLKRVRDSFQSDVQSGGDSQASPSGSCVAYFSLEYGIHESVGLYAGGLGCLSGDHLKTASDLGLPLVGVGLMYRQGYMQQYLNDDGWQQERYVENEIQNMPLLKVCNAQGEQVRVSIPLPDGRLHAVVWRLNVGRVPLFLLDTNIPENRPEHRRVTARLYDVDRTMRLRQELLLGIGGVRALVALGYEPKVCHINEGHAAFLYIGRAEYLVTQKNLGVDTALEIVRRTSVFTTHTPVPAGNEAFHVDLVRPHLAALQEEIAIPVEKTIAWGVEPGNSNGYLIMTILGLRLSAYCNGVSRLHGQVARRMWGHLWPARPRIEIPIEHVTNGVHISSWISTEMGGLFDRYLGPAWRRNPCDETILGRVMQIPDDELWRAHQVGRLRLIRMAREVGERQFNSRSATRSEVAQIKSVLNYDALTVGFARRFAAYKRATLLLKQPDRLEALLCNRDHPLQFVFAGKAHPADDAGKDLIRQVVQFARRVNARQRVIFLENYDIHIARYMVQGVDIWLNNPRRPEEASGTSGMKAALNGALHVSVLDGWWDEAYSPSCGWAIGRGEEYENHEFHDRVESQSLYNLLENEIIPRFYARPDGDYPTAWTEMMKHSIRMVLKSFSSHRMVREYETRYYRSALAAYDRLTADGAGYADGLVRQYRKLESLWHGVRVDAPVSDRDITMLHVGDSFSATVTVRLGALTPEDVNVEVYFGRVNADNEIVESHPQEMTLDADHGNGVYQYRQRVTCKSSGRYGFTARVTPKGSEWWSVIPGLMTWAEE